MQWFGPEALFQNPTSVQFQFLKPFLLSGRRGFRVLGVGLRATTFSGYKVVLNSGGPPFAEPFCNFKNIRIWSLLRGLRPRQGPQELE